MERSDFSSVITIIRKFISDERTIMDNITKTEVKIDQVHLLELVFASFVDDESMLDFSFDNGLVCRWVNGQAKISPKILSFYLKEDNRELLSSDIEYRLFPLMYGSAMAARDIYNLLIQDSTISPEAKDTLFIVDNFNTTVSQDNMLSVVMKYRCRMLFTTRSRFDNYAAMELEEISDRKSLLLLMGCFYSDAEKYTSILEQIIDTVHRHTLAVELAARLLEIGILEPLSLLNKLKEEKASLDASDKIGITKDGQSRKATYYDHIHTLFSLYQLDKEERDIMRSLIFIPTAGISARVFAKWLKCRDMNVVNDLVEKGFVQLGVGHTIALHPMIQEVAVIEMNPSVQNCRELLNSLKEICLRHGEEVFYYKKMFQTIENVIKLITNDDTLLYIQFLKNVFPYMEKYQETQGMELVLKELSLLLEDNTVGTISDRALLLDYRASCETKIQKMIKLEKEAISLIAEITPDNAFLVSNFYANLGGYYKLNGNLELAKQAMEQAIRITEQYGLTCYHDCIVQIANYAVLLTDMG